MKNKYIPNRHDIIWIDFEPQAGKEIMKRRPALVLSSRLYNQFGKVLVCPLTTQIKNRPFEVVVQGKIPVAVLCDQVKSFDWRVRKAKFKEKVDPLITEEVIDKIGTLLTQ